jgi:hypothetical protein
MLDIYVNERLEEEEASAEDKREISTLGPFM